MASANPSAPCVSGADIPTHHWPERRHSRDGLIDDMDGGREVGRRCFDRLHCVDMAVPFAATPTAS
jgi:hypothetical protein